MIYIRVFVLSVLPFLMINYGYAFSWQDAWLTPDQQAQNLMQKGKFNEAQALFQNDQWRGAAAYRAKNYLEAAKDFTALNSALGFYNAGNALAQLGKYKEAIKAYDKALALNPTNPDAIYNRDLVKSLLKKEQKQQNDQNKNQNQNQNQNQKSSANNNSSKDLNNQNNKEAEKNQQTAKQNEKEQQNQEPKTGTEKKQANQQKKANQQPNNEPNKSSESASNREKQLREEQWLKLIPDDPGGLLKEKFLRDYLKRQAGWYQ